VSSGAELVDRVEEADDGSPRGNGSDWILIVSLNLNGEMSDASDGWK
jgi:hypothetical protein